MVETIPRRPRLVNKLSRACLWTHERLDCPGFASILRGVHALSRRPLNSTPDAKKLVCNKHPLNCDCYNWGSVLDDIVYTYTPSCFSLSLFNTASCSFVAQSYHAHLDSLTPLLCASATPYSVVTKPSIWHWRSIPRKQSRQGNWRVRHIHRYSTRVFAFSLTCWSYKNAWSWPSRVQPKGAQPFHLVHSPKQIVILSNPHPTFLQVMPTETHLG